MIWGLRCCEATASARYSLSDSSIKHVVYEWLNVVAKHLDFDACVTAAKEALQCLLPLAEFPCGKGGTIYGDLKKHACLLYTIHNCGICGHQCSKVPKVCGNPLAVLRCQLVKEVLYLAKLPVTADGKITTSTGVKSHVACLCQVRGGTCGGRSCLEAASNYPHSLSKSRNLLWLVTMST